MVYTSETRPIRGAGSLDSLTRAALLENWPKTKTPESKIDNFSFGPAALTVPAGATVTWNRDDIPHTVVSGDRVFRSRVLDTDDKFSFKFEKAGASPASLRSSENEPAKLARCEPSGMWMVLFPQPGLGLRWKSSSIPLITHGLRKRSRVKHLAETAQNRRSVLQPRYPVLWLCGPIEGL